MRGLAANSSLLFHGLVKREHYGLWRILEVQIAPPRVRVELKITDEEVLLVEADQQGQVRGRTDFADEAEKRAV